MWGAHPPNHPVPADPNAAARFAAAARHLPRHAYLAPGGVQTTLPRRIVVTVSLTMPILALALFAGIFLEPNSDQGFGPGDWHLEQWLLVANAAAIFSFGVVHVPAVGPGLAGRLQRKMAVTLTWMCGVMCLAFLGLAVLDMITGLRRPGHGTTDFVSTFSAASWFLVGAFATENFYLMSKCLRSL